VAIYPVILSGGSGNRLWPLSRAAMPKQLLPLVTELSLLQETALRVSRLPGTASPMLVCNNDHRFLVAEQLRASGIKPHAIILEPAGRNTAPAAAIASLALIEKDPDAVLVLMPSDHVIENEAAFHSAVTAATEAASQGYIITFGLTPAYPATGYGYIERGPALDEPDDCHRIARFVEKPDQARAEQMIASGQYFWNSGIFVFSAARCIEEMRRLQPRLLDVCARSLRHAHSDLEFVRLDAEAFAAAPSISFDHAIMEHTQQGAVIPVDMGWSDVGSWKTLWEVRNKDMANNVIQGDVMSHNVSGTLIHAQDRMVAAIGVDDLVIVETKDAVLVAHKSAAQDVQVVVKRLQAAGRTEHLTHRRTYRPWGYFESIDEGERFQVKRLMVNPGAKLSLQMHHHRAEHWVVVKGTARIWRGDEVSLLTENQSTYIPIGTAHRLQNPGKVPLHIVEVQSGCYLGEDDIVRFDDIYDRATAKVGPMLPDSESNVPSTNVKELVTQ
jgi:mannose-1-phosphate guanylyltransferase/mannose-6-phosphate isomerase